MRFIARSLGAKRPRDPWSRDGRTMDTSLFAWISRLPGELLDEERPGRSRSAPWCHPRETTSVLPEHHSPTGECK